MSPPSLANWKLENNKGYGEADLPPELWRAQSDVEVLYERLRQRLRERRARQIVPDVLYHYTDVRGMHGMFDSLTMWLSDAAFMNDPLEGTWVHRRASLLAADQLGDTPLANQVLGQIEGQLTAPDLWDQSLRGGEPDDRHDAAMQDAFMPAFIASFTEEGDLLSQWRGYGAGGDGVSIGFDLRKLDFCQVETLPGEMTRPILIKVEYDEKRQDAEVVWILKEAKKVYDRHIGLFTDNADAKKFFIQRFYHPIRDALYWLRWEFKSPYYSEEKEWRLVAMPFGVSRKRSRVANGHIVPYLEMPLPQTAARPVNQLAIPRIVLGPRCPASALRSIRGLLTNVAYPIVDRSRLALR